MLTRFRFDMVPEKADGHGGASVLSSAASIVVQLAAMLQTVWAYAALPLSGALVVMKHTVSDEVLDYPPVADSVVLAPFFFGLFCMQSLDRRQRGEHADTSWGSPIYHLCL